MEERNNLTNNNIDKNKKNLNIIDKINFKENKRNYGIDLLKIFSVINIIIIHINKFSHQLSFYPLYTKSDHIFCPFREPPYSHRLF